MRWMWVLTVLIWGAAPMAEANDDCTALFAGVQSEIETNYIGFAQTIAADPTRLAVYRDRVEQHRAETQDAAPDACTAIVQVFLADLEDPHLFLLADPRVTDEEALAARALAGRWRVPVRVSMRRDRETLDGVWVNPDFDVALVREGRRPLRYVAIVTASRSPDWRRGDVAARFERAGADWSAVLYRSQDRAALHSIALLERDGELLHMAPITWARRPDEAGDGAYDPEHPRAPRYINLNRRAALVTAPSFAPEHRAPLDALLRAHGPEIAGRDLLVIDLRGNEGGSASVGQALAPFYYSPEREAALGPRIYPMALSSPRWIGYYSSIRDGLPAGEERQIYDDFLRRMEAAPGALVPFFEDAAIAQQLYQVAAPRVVHESPRHVAIIVDRHSVSAAEAFVLEAARSSRVTIFGEPTGGSIDYQNVAMWPVGEGRWRHLLGMPSSAASDEIATRGLNASGVPVDVSLAEGEDWIASVLAHYGLGRADIGTRQ
jgi:hypothetical protein